ncbi:MAG: aminotransferase class V-fold PLP-dependent enzyme, partial [Myxococcota bacterium]|nr:aminotransferase class V-fold PLP-dependent enzyme [Myxococcota bacterium]
MSIRDDFPSVRPRCYADSAAKTLTPHAVVAVMNEYYQSLDANVLRGLHRRAVQCTELVEEARRAVASTVNASAEHLVFCQNATHAINQLASGLQLPTGSRIVSSLLEHHSNLLPWMRLAQRCEGELLFLEPDENGVLELAQAQDLLSAGKVALLALTQVSNVLGSEQPIAELCRLARDAGAVSVVDAAQSVGHGLADVQLLGCDALVWSGHKSFGPTGTGALWMRAELLERLEPSMVGGGAIDALGPDGFVVAQEPAWRRFEVGTPNIAGLIGLGAAAHYLNEQL